MNRAELRREKRETEKSQQLMTMTKTAFESSLFTARKQERDKIFEFVVSYYSSAVALVLRDKWGFGRKRLVRILDQIGDVYDSITRNYISIDDIREIILKETGIDLNKRRPT